MEREIKKARGRKRERGGGIVCREVRKRNRVKEERGNETDEEEGEAGESK